MEKKTTEEMTKEMNGEILEAIKSYYSFDPSISHHLGEQGIDAIHLTYDSKLGEATVNEAIARIEAHYEADHKDVVEAWTRHVMDTFEGKITNVKKFND